MIKKLYIPKFASKTGIITIKIYFDVPQIVDQNNSKFTLNGDIYSLDLTAGIKTLDYVLTQFDQNLGYIEFNQIINNKNYNAIPIIKNIEVDFSNVTNIVKSECKNSFNSIGYFDKVINQRANSFPTGVAGGLNQFNVPIKFDPHPNMLKAIVKIKYEAPASSKNDYIRLGYFVYVVTTTSTSVTSGIRQIYDPFYARTNETNQDKEIILKINNIIFYHKINNDIIYNAINENGEIIFECDADEFKVELTGDSAFVITDVTRQIILGNTQDNKHLTLLKQDEYYYTNQEHDIYKFGYIKKAFIDLDFTKISDNEFYKIYVNNKSKGLIINQNQSKKSHSKIEFDKSSGGNYQHTDIKLSDLVYEIPAIKNTFKEISNENYTGFNIVELQNGDVDIEITASNEIANNQQIVLDVVSDWHDLQNISVTIEG